MVQTLSLIDVLLHLENGSSPNRKFHTAITVGFGCQKKQEPRKELWADLAGMRLTQIFHCA
jgi:hypothetical protein